MNMPVVANREKITMADKGWLQKDPYSLQALMIMMMMMINIPVAINLPIYSP